MENKSIRYQLDLMNEVRALTSINMVTCGNCGAIILHRMIDLRDFDKEHVVECHSCKFEMDLCDCPDVFYDGMQELNEE